MKKHHLLLVVIICLSNFLFGTGDLYITLNGLSIHPTSGNYYIKEVIDVRLNKELLGFVTNADPIGSITVSDIMDDKPYDVKFEKNYPIRFESDVFTELGYAGLVLVSKETNSIPVIMKINHMFLSEVISNTTKYACVEVNIDFYTSFDETTYLEYTYANGLFLQCPKNQKQKAKLFAANLADQINQAFKAFHNAMDSEKSLHLPVDRSTMYKREVRLPQSPDTKENGIFRSYNDFRDGIMETDIRLSIIEELSDPGCAIFQFEILDDMNVIQNVWGVQYNQHCYYNLNGNFIRLIKEKENYYLLNIGNCMQRLDNKNKNIRIALAATMVLLFGGSFTIYETEIPPLKIDHYSGLARPELKYDTRNFEGYLLFYVRKTKNKDPELWINNSFHCKFKPDTFYETKISARDEPVKVTVVTGNNKSVEVLEDVIFNESFYEIDYKRRRFVLFPKRGIVSRKTVMSDIENGRLVKVDAIPDD